MNIITKVRNPVKCCNTDNSEVGYSPSPIIIIIAIVDNNNNYYYGGVIIAFQRVITVSVLIKRKI